MVVFPDFCNDGSVYFFLSLPSFSLMISLMYVGLYQHSEVICPLLSQIEHHLAILILFVQWFYLYALDRCTIFIICFGFVFGSLACWSRLGYGPLVLAWMFLYATFPIQNL